MLRKICDYPLGAGLAAAFKNAPWATYIFLLLLAFAADTVLAQKSQGELATSPPQKLTTAQRSFQIPFTVGQDSNLVVEVTLFESRDFGKSWKKLATRSPGAGDFPFSCQQDGEFWFALQTTNRDGTKIPPTQLKPELRIVVDTKRPELQFDVRPDAAGRIVSHWIARDQNLDHQSLTIQYQSQTEAKLSPDKWTTIPTNTISGDDREHFQNQLAWWPQTADRSLRVRGLIRDYAGNQAAVVRQILAPQVAGTQLPNQATTPCANGQCPMPGNAVAQKTEPAATNYLQSRIPAAFAGRYGLKTFLPNSFGKPRYGTRLSEKTNSNSNVRQASAQSPITKNDAPQPPRANNRFANAPGNTSSAKPPSGHVESTQWQSRTAGGNSNRVAQNSTQAWEPRDKSDLPTQTNSTAVKSADVPVNNAIATGKNKTSLMPFRPPAQSAVHVAKRQTPTEVATDGRPDPVAQATENAPTNRQGTTVPRSNGFDNVQWSASTTGSAKTATSSADVQPVSNLKTNNQTPIPPSNMIAGPQLENLKRMARPSNSKRFQLDYDIDAIGPDGLRAVELWITPDGGKNWQRHATDNDRRSPVDVEIDREGIFGFRIIVISNDGLRTRTPRRGDLADMWVNIDTTRPKAQITAAPYGRGNTSGKLLVQWQVSDPNLALRPIRLSYSPRAQGPWTTIEDGIRNVGEFVWKPAADVPEQVYLQLEAADIAGNKQTHQLARPIDISGLIPRGHIRGITPIRKRDGPVPTEPTGRST